MSISIKRVQMRANIANYNFHNSLTFIICLPQNFQPQSIDMQ